jgi:hypothetical protein
MNYSDKFKIQWFLPQRNGTRTILEILKKFDFEIRHHSCTTSDERIGYYTILNVRNPYSRVVSLYYLYCFNNQNFNIPFQQFVEIVKISPRDKFIYSKDGVQLKKNHDLYNIHYDFFLENLIGRNPEKIVRIENLEEDIVTIPFLKNKKDIYIELIKNNPYSNEFSKMVEKKPWKTFYNEENSLIIYEKLRNQFLYYGYDKNSWKDVTP